MHISGQFLYRCKKFSITSIFSGLSNFHEYMENPAFPGLLATQEAIKYYFSNHIDKFAQEKSPNTAIMDEMRTW